MKNIATPNASDAGTIKLGDALVNRLGFGAMQLTGPGVWGMPKNVQEAGTVLKRAIELGVNFIDTADSYGPEVSENLIAEFLSPYRKGLVIATKGGLTRPAAGSWIPNCKPEYLIQCVHNSLKRLHLDTIDLYQLHAVDRAVPIEDSVAALKKMQDLGKIKYIGLSNVSVEEIKKAQKIAKIVSVQNLYNFEDRRSDPVIEYCEANKLVFIPWFPLASGKLSKSALATLAERKKASPFQIALAWLLKRSPAILPIPGTSSLAHLDENIAAASIQLTDEEFKSI